MFPPARISNVTPQQDPVQELPRLEKQIVEQAPANIPVITEGFRIGYVLLLCAFVL